MCAFEQASPTVRIGSHCDEADQRHASRDADLKLEIRYLRASRRPELTSSRMNRLAIRSPRAA